jgi:hypothetical protein
MVIKIKHPKFGHVEFSNPTLRQIQVLERCQEIINIVKTEPNDSKLGSEVRKILKSVDGNKTISRNNK